MKAEMQEFMNEQTRVLADQAQKFRRNPERFMRKVLVDSAEGLKSLKRPLRKVAHSGVKLTEVSQDTLQSLIELQSEAVTATLTSAATRLERAAEAEGVVDLVFDQIEMLPATRDRVVDEAVRAVEIFKHAGRDVRKIANHTYATVTGRTDEELAAAKKTGARKTKRAVRKTGARVRKQRVTAKREVTSRAAARSASKTLSSPYTGRASKSAAGSALSQRKAPEKATSPAAATAASKTLRDGRTSKRSKSAAGSALAQKNASRKGR
jgi:hypothetical protein